MKESDADRRESRDDRRESFADRGESVAVRGEGAADRGESVADRGESVADKRERAADRGESVAHRGERDHEEWTENWTLSCPLSMQMYELKKKSQKKQEMTKDECGTGFESISCMDVIRSHPPKIIVGFSQYATGKYYHVKCSDISHSLKVRSEVLRYVAPKLICEFLESRIQPQGRINSAQKI
jgi:hypothetical protein